MTQAAALSGRTLLAVLGVWLLLAAAAGAVTVLAARGFVADWGREGGALIPFVVAEVYAAVVVAAAIVLGRRLPAAVALSRAGTSVCAGHRRHRDGVRGDSHVSAAPAAGVRHRRCVWLDP